MGDTLFLSTSSSVSAVQKASRARPAIARVRPVRLALVEYFLGNDVTGDGVLAGTSDTCKARNYQTNIVAVTGVGPG